MKYDYAELYIATGVTIHFDGNGENDLALQLAEEEKNLQRMKASEHCSLDLVAVSQKKIEILTGEEAKSKASEMSNAIKSGEYSKPVYKMPKTRRVRRDRDQERRDWFEENRHELAAGIDPDND